MTIENQPQTTEQPVGNFYILRQDGILEVRDANRISLSKWRSASSSERQKVKARWNETKQLLGTETLNINVLSRLIGNKEARDEATESTYRQLGNMYGIEGGVAIVESKFGEYARQANNISKMITKGHLDNDKVLFEMANEVQAENNPVELAILTLDERYAPRVRFEAKRKLELMDLAAKIDHRERQTNTKEHYRMFMDFLNENVWLPTMKRGDIEYIYLLSSHDPNTNACTSVTTLSREEGEGTTLNQDQKLTLLPRRKFEPNGHEIPIYVTPREKSPEAKILKLLRKGAENPALAVDDEIGFMGVLDSVKDIEAFNRQLRKSSIDVDSMLTFEEVEDTLTGEERKPNSIGGSSEVRMFKCFVRMNGARIEMILHTNQTYLDYLYRSGVAHDEYEARRLFDSGVMELLFPPSIYGYSFEQMKTSSLENVRKIIRSK